MIKRIKQLLFLFSFITTFGTAYAQEDTKTSSTGGNLTPAKFSVGIYSQADALLGNSFFWKNPETGVGLNRNLGFGIKSDYHLGNKLAATLSLGAANWTLIRDYIEEDVFIYEEAEKLFRGQLAAGIKYYITTGLYVSPEIGVNLVRHTTLSTEFGDEIESQRVSKMAFHAGAAIGYERKIGPILVDFSPRYQFLRYESGQFASLRLAVSYILR